MLNKKIFFQDFSNSVVRVTILVLLNLRNTLKKYNLTLDWKIFSGIMFNHESEFRKSEYLFMKIINEAIKIKGNKSDKLILGSVDYVRDWSYAKDISKGIYKIANEGKASSYVLGSGKGRKIQNIVEIVFDYFN